MTEKALTPEDTKALADKVMENTFVPKKVPHAENVDAQIAAVTGALASALLTAMDLPVTIFDSEDRTKIGKQLVALGIRQTKHVDLDAVQAPHWITDGVRQESIVIPEQAPHTEADPVAARTATAPKRPKRIKASNRAQRL